MKFSTSNHSSSSVVLFLSLGFQFANTVSAKSSIRGLQGGDVTVTATVATPPTPPATPTEPDACVTDCGTGPWSTLCLHLQTSLSTGIDFDTAMGDYSFTAMELEMLDGSNSTSLFEDEGPMPGPAGGRPSGPSDSMSRPSLDESPTGPSGSADAPGSPSGSLDEPPSGTGPSGSADAPGSPSGSLDEPPSGTGPSGSADAPGSPSGSLDEPPRD